MLIRPPHIPESITKAPLTCPWNNAIALQLDNFDALPKHLADAVAAINYKGKMALGLACLEWIFWRLADLTDVSDALNRLEAAWASQISIHYSRSLNYLDVRDEVMTQGNPDGPLQGALLKLQFLHLVYRKGKPQMISESTRCATLAAHILPADCGFEAWLQTCLESLGDAYPNGADYDRRAKIIDHSAEPPIPRAWFTSLTTPPDATADGAAWAAFLGDLDPANNPYLVPADEMRSNGFVGDPYRMT